MINVKFNYSDQSEKIRPMHCVGGGPKSGGASLSTDASGFFKEIGVPSCRLHDIEGAYGMNQFVDVHCIFPDFEADENDDRNYNFAATDKYLTAIKNCGANVFYRLGESIDHFEKKLFVRPPKDFEKWARICEHIIRHYNQGWAYGYYMDIEYWEIWNEPESRAMWTGTYDEFYEFYTVVSKHLKKCFPNLKIGGYSAVGFYSEVRNHDHDWYNPWFNTMMPFLDGFFNYVKDKDVPLDFFSWHSYALSAEEMGQASKFIRAYLDQKGYQKTESFLTEYNVYYTLNATAWAEKPQYASDVLSSLIVAQNSPLDRLYLYDLRLSIYNGVFYRDPLDRKLKILPAFYAMKFFGDLYRLGTAVKADYDNEKGVYVLCATDGKTKGVAIADREFGDELCLEVDSKSVHVIEVSTQIGAQPREYDLSVKDKKCVLKTQKQYLYYLTF